MAKSIWSVRGGGNIVQLDGDDEDTMEYLTATSGSSMLEFTLEACSEVEQPQGTAGNMLLNLHSCHLNISRFCLNSNNSIIIVYPT